MKEDISIQNKIKLMFNSEKSVFKYNVQGLTERETWIVKNYFKNNSKILDLGCGVGRTTVPLSKNFEVIGVDIAENLINLAKKKNPEIDYRIMDAVNLKFPKNTFDIVLFSYNGLDYIYPKNRRIKTIIEINRVLNKKGLFVFSSHNKVFLKINQFYLKTLLSNIFEGRLLKNYFYFDHSFGNIPTYVQNPLIQIMEIKKHGFDFVTLVSSGKLKNKNNLLISILDKWPYYIFRKNN